MADHAGFTSPLYVLGLQTGAAEVFSAPNAGMPSPFWYWGGGAKASGQADEEPPVVVETTAFFKPTYRGRRR